MERINDSDLNIEDYSDLLDSDGPDSSFEVNSETDSSDSSSSTRKTKTPINKKDLTKKIILIASGIILALIVIYLGGVYYFKSHFLPNTYLSGYNASYETLESANQNLEQISHARKVSLIGKDEVVSDLKAEDIGLNLVKEDENQQLFETQNEFAWPLYFFHAATNKTGEDLPYDEEALTQKMMELPIVSGPQVVKTENAKAVFNGTDYEVKDEVYGTEVNPEALKEEIHQALVTGKSEINLEDANCYVQPVTLNNNETLNASVGQLNNIVNSSITYDFKTSQEVVNKNVFANWLSTDDNGNVIVNDQDIANYIQLLKDKYDTKGKEHSFVNSAGENMTFMNWYTGWEIDAASEAAALKDNILTGQVITKEPIYSSTGRDRALGTTISGTYLEISIGDQRMWFYKDGECLVSTSVVTGDPTDGHATPTGLFELQGKDTNVTLEGFNSDGSKYASPVTFWMPFDGGVGVHDASWRGSFGGSIFRGNGSHGCVNTPYSAVRTIYNNINVGDPVVVY